MGQSRVTPGPPVVPNPKQLNRFVGYLRSRRPDTSDHPYLYFRMAGFGVSPMGELRMRNKKITKVWLSVWLDGEKSDYALFDHKPTKEDVRIAWEEKKRGVALTTGPMSVPRGVKFEPTAYCVENP
jgi:hypothetical protein